MEEPPLEGSWVAEAGSQAPPPFMVDANLAVPCEVSGLDLWFEADAEHGRGTGRGRLRFTLPQSGRPFFDLVPRPLRLVVDEQQLPPERLRLVRPPDDPTFLRMLDEQLDAGEHTIEVEYTLGTSTAQFTNGGVGLGLFMTDLEQRGYLERHAPANLEFDQIPMNVEVRVSGHNGEHNLFSNGTVSTDGSNTWRISYPDYFTCSSCYLHLTNRPVYVREGLYDGMDKQIRITSYGEQLADVTQALQQASLILRELEQTFGPYPHESLLIYCTGNIEGGMEYAGATMTSLAALGHELTHSWFARGVMPANGNAGWIDEAIARWRDLGYPSANAISLRPPVNLAGFSPYRRHTPADSYAMGSLLLSELDHLFSPAGLRPLLANLFREKQRQVITTEFFRMFLEQQTGILLGPTFNRYVYGKSEGEDQPEELEDVASGVIKVETEEMKLPTPPRAFTPDQLRSLL